MATDYFVNKASTGEAAPYATKLTAAQELATVLTYHDNNPSDAIVSVREGTYTTDYIGDLPNNNLTIISETHLMPILPVIDVDCPSWDEATALTLTNLSLEKINCNATVIQKRGSFYFNSLFVRRSADETPASIIHPYSVSADSCIFEGSSHLTGRALLVDWINSGVPRGYFDRSIFLDSDNGLFCANSFSAMVEVLINDCIFKGNTIGMRESMNVVPVATNCGFYENGTNVSTVVTLVDPVYTDPLFVDPANARYDLFTGSDYIGAGVDGGNIGVYQGSGFTGLLVADYYRSLMNILRGI